MFLHVSVILLGGGGSVFSGGSASRGESASRGGWTDTPPLPRNQKSGRYTSYWNVFLFKISECKCETICFPFQLIAKDLQHSVLDFTKRLHSVEVERRDLRSEIGRLRTEQHKHAMDEQNELQQQVHHSLPLSEPSGCKMQSPGSALISEEYDLVRYIS